MEFPMEIWKLILCHLDKDTLKQCLLISDEFRAMIIKSPELMRKLTVVFFNDNWEAKLPFVTEYGYFVRSMKFDDCGFRSMKDVRKILTLTPNVESLVFYNCYILEAHEINHMGDNEANEGQDFHEGAELNHFFPNPADEEAPVIAGLPAEQIVEAPVVEDPPAEQIVEDAPVIDGQPAEQIVEDQGRVETLQQQDLLDPDDDEALDLKKLTHLHLDSCNIAEKLIRNLRNCTTLRSLKLTFYYQNPVNFFTDFICQQSNLQELFCIGWSDMVFKSLFKEDITRERIKFKLRKFTLECELSFHANFSIFLRAQAAHIKELELTCYNINFHYYRLLFNNFHSLQKLTLPIDWFLTDDRANDIRNCRISSLKELELVGSNDDIATFKTIIDIFPNVEVLKAENLMHFSLNGILEKFERLRVIKAENFRVETMLFVNLPSLKVIEAAFLVPMSLSFLWENLAENCVNLEQLTIKDIGHFKLNESIRKEIGIIVQNLARFKNLKYCEIISSPQDPMVNGDEGQNEIQPPLEHAFYKVIVENFPNKTPIIKISHYFAQHCAVLVDKLKETFSKCDILEM